jgi:TolB-like protein/Tfp pilus assembly protein PilF
MTIGGEDGSTLAPKGDDNNESAICAIASAPSVFISYGSQDSAVADAVLEALEQQGIGCWIAPRDVTAGTYYPGEIVHAIDATKATVLILSAHSASSPHVLREVERAASKRHPIISLRIDRTPLPDEFQYFLNTSQWLEASSGDAGRAMTKLIAAVRLAIQSPVSTPAAAATSDATPSSSTGRSTSRSVILAASVIGLAIAGVAADRIWQSIRQPAGTAAPTDNAATRPMAVEAAFSPPARSIAVLPFVNMSGDSKQDYFSDGISDELLNSLSRLDQLQVTARTSSFVFKGQNVDVSTIAHRLNVAAVLEGSVRRSGNTVRITAQLINAVSGFQLWSQTYDRNLTDILKIQLDVATSIAKQLEARLMGDEAAKIELGGTNNPDAYDAYLRGRQLQSRESVDEANDRAALALFDRAIALDPNYALAYVGRSGAIGDLAIFSAKAVDRHELNTQALEAANRAVALAPELGDAHATLATTYAYSMLDFARAAPEIDRALTLAPGSARVQRTVADFSSLLGRFDMALRAARRAVSLDSQNIASFTTLGIVLFQSRRYDEALTTLKHAMVLDPGSSYIEFFITSALTASGQLDQARLLCESPTTPLQKGARQRCLALVYHALGRQADAEREMKQAQDDAGDDAAFSYACILAQWGDKPAALRWLKKAEQLRDPEFQVLRVAWELDSIRDEPAFKAIEARMNFPR